MADNIILGFVCFRNPACAQVAPPQLIFSIIVQRKTSVRREDIYWVSNMWRITSTPSENQSIFTQVNDADMKRNITRGLAKQYRDAGGSVEPDALWRLVYTYQHTHPGSLAAKIISRTQTLCQLQPIKCTQAGMLFPMQQQKTASSHKDYRMICKSLALTILDKHRHVSENYPQK